jgi:hemerythrin-like domain-containing protein
MQYSPATQVLVDEHDVILSVIEAVEAVATRGLDGPFPQEFYEKAFEFFPAFADKCHHAKEEDHLFPLLERRGLPKEGGPLGCMLHEHDEGRRLVATILAALARTKAGDAAAQAVVQRAAMAYAAMLRQHIHKENNVLFVWGDQLLDEADKAALLESFACAKHPALPAGAHEKYIAMAQQLRNYAGISTACGCAAHDAPAGCQGCSGR